MRVFGLASLLMGLAFIVWSMRSNSSLAETHHQESRRSHSPVKARPPDQTFEDESGHLSDLPADLESLQGHASLLKDWEEALVANRRSVLPQLLERYMREENPAYKGVLAVLVAADPSTHDILLEDFRSNRMGEILQGFALFALVTNRGHGKGDSPQAELSFWTNLVKLADQAPILVELWKRLRDQPDDEETQKLWRHVYQFREFQLTDGTVASTYNDPNYDGRATDSIRGTQDARVRLALLEAHDRKWDWRWVKSNAYRALWMSARQDLEFAGDLFQHYVEGGDRDRILTGLELLSNEEIPARQVERVGALARGSLDDPGVFTSAVEILGHQKGSVSESYLLDTCSMVGSRIELKACLLEAMENHGSRAFEPMARAELASENSEVRECALKLLATVAVSNSIDALVNAANRDPVEEVRRTALYLMVQANRWSPIEEEALHRVARQDPARPLRNLASRLIAAKDRTSDDAWDDSDIEPAVDLLDFTKEPAE